MQYDDHSSALMHPTAWPLGIDRAGAATLAGENASDQCILHKTLKIATQAAEHLLIW